MANPKLTRLRFTYEDDLVLLREFLNANPIFNPQGWDVIHNNVSITTGKLFLLKTLKQHLQLLIEIFLKKVKVDQVRSGIEEPYCEKDVLLQEVSSLCQEHNYDFKQKKKPASKEQRTIELGKRSRDDFAQAYVKLQDIIEDPTEEVIPLPIDHDYICSQDIPENKIIDIPEQKVEMAEKIITPLKPTCFTPSTSKQNMYTAGPTRSRVKKGEPLKKNALLYLTEKNDRDSKIKLRELDLEERKISIEEKKLCLKEQELKLTQKYLEQHHREVMVKLDIEKKRADVEVEEKKLANQLMQSQQKLIDQLLLQRQ